MPRTPPPFLPTEATAAVEEIGRALARARLARGDTQQIAAQRCGVHWQTISRIERGDARVAVGTVFAVLVVYGMGRRLFELAEDDEATKILMQRALPRRAGGSRAGASKRAADRPAGAADAGDDEEGAGSQPSGGVPR